jgi:SAM-dependent methyltransferase
MTDDTPQLRKLTFEKCLHLLGLSQKCRVADIACGNGWAGDMAQSLYDADVTYIDARDRIPKDGKERKFKLENVLIQNYKDKDAIFVLGLLYHLTLEQQLLLNKLLKDIPFILDTHVLDDLINTSSFEGIENEIVKIGEFKGIYRIPTYSSKCSYWYAENLFKQENPFVHTEKSLRKLFNNHKLIKVGEITPSRSYYIGMPF